MAVAADEGADFQVVVDFLAAEVAASPAEADFQVVVAADVAAEVASFLDLNRGRVFAFPTAA